ncbi:2OG-Fe dioxygenase family protein [Streptomyces sp. AC495_CC817]|uniref:2OG-Fe dioxygenase family protein n=1 Tax=Streptomyces sp. AC495_CC817 TaxID=2823900 RepID=UPI001C2518C4|nr:2OG-Fe dioxygenase family protein [Streptomyces sp. AC495_CC817]
MTDPARIHRRLSALRSRFIADRALFLPARETAEILTGLGASSRDLEALRRMGDDLVGDPTLPFRRSRNGRFALDFDARAISRLAPQPFVLTAEEDFVREDSGVVRRFDELTPALAGNSALAALLVFKFLMIESVLVLPRAGLDYDAARSVTTLFALRTVTSAALLGEPAREGVHTDGVDHTMTVFADSRNMSHDSAVTTLHTREQRTGAAWDETDPAHRIARVQHTSFLDLLLVADNERKHSVSPLVAADPEREATRDMLIFFTRRPTAPSHVSAPYDSFVPHDRHPVVVDVGPPLPRADAALHRARSR